MPMADHFVRIPTELWKNPGAIFFPSAAVEQTSSRLKRLVLMVEYFLTLQPMGREASPIRQNVWNSQTDPGYQ